MGYFLQSPVPCFPVFRKINKTFGEEIKENGNVIFVCRFMAHLDLKYYMQPA